MSHGFVRSHTGAVITFDAPGAGKAPGHGTTPTSEDSSGAIVGFYVDDNGVAHGFVRP